MQKNKQATLLDLWLPFLENAYGNEKSAPQLTARSVLMYDLNSNKTIYEKDAKERMPMASLTKIMTAIIALENRKENDRYIVFPSALVGEDSMGLKSGEILTLNELLHGLVLNSGNDASEVIAMNYADGRDAFVQAMNDKAAALGLTDTNFTNPSGLQGDGIQYTTAYDLLVISRYALEKFPEFAAIAEKPEYLMPATKTHREFQLYNETNLLTTYPGVKGLKTGYTPEAGMCLITYLNYKDHRIIGIILNSESRREEMKALLDYSLDVIGVVPPAHQ